MTVKTFWFILTVTHKNQMHEVEYTSLIVLKVIPDAKWKWLKMWLSSYRHDHNMKLCR